MQITKTSPRTFKLERSFKELETPFFFPSISSICTNLTINEYFNTLITSSYPGFLISAYDIYHNEDRKSLIKDVSSITESEVFTLLDSGNYEAFWNKDKEWDLKKFESVLNPITVDMSFSFDVYGEDGKDIDTHVKETVENSLITTSMMSYGTTVPIIHSDPKDFSETVRKVVESLYPEIIGITERDLGSSLLERAKTLKTIRDELSKVNVELPIHLLGTGNPVSLVVYSLCGADLFDGLEWCKCAANPDTGHLNHFIQKELVYCNCDACNSQDVSYEFQTMFHNLIFYKNLMNEIGGALKDGRESEILSKYLPKNVVPNVMKIAGLK